MQCWFLEEVVSSTSQDSQSAFLSVEIVLRNDIENLLQGFSRTISRIFQGSFFVDNLENVVGIETKQ